MTKEMKKQINDLLDVEVRTAERAMKEACLKTLTTLAAQTSTKCALGTLNRAIEAVRELPMSRAQT